jgi:hypothetical protein
MQMALQEHVILETRDDVRLGRDKTPEGLEWAGRLMAA